MMSMQTSITRAELLTYVARQTAAFFPDRTVNGSDFGQAVDHALERLEHCISHIRLRNFFDGAARFDHRNTDQYAMFLYLLANALHRLERTPLAANVYALNKALHAIDAFYEVELPAIFAFQHPVGTVLGRAAYADYFFVYQRCSVGSSIDGESPTFGEGVVMYGGSGVIGPVTVGANVWLSINTTVQQGTIPSDSIVFGASPHLVVKNATRNVRRDIFGMP
jgi:serine O-acetyltransferase